MSEPLNEPDPIMDWVHRLFGISSDRQVAAQEQLALWGIRHVAAELSPATADGSLGAVLLTESISELVARGIEEQKLLAKLRRDPDVWPAWAEIRAAGLLARQTPADGGFALEARREAGRHADFTFTTSDDEPPHAIEFKAIGLSDAEVAFSQRMAPLLRGLLPRFGIATMHVPDTEPFTMNREERRYHRREAERHARHLEDPIFRTIAACVIVGHGTENSYVRRLTARFNEALGQLPHDETCWVAFHWSNGAPIAMVRRALAEAEIPDHVAGIVLVGSVATPGRLDNFVMWFIAPFNQESGEMDWHSDTGVDHAQAIFRAVNESGGVRPSLITAPVNGRMNDILYRGGERRIVPFNLILSPDPPDLVPHETQSLRAKRSAGGVVAESRLTGQASS
jgi:hypothetical protein